MLIAIGDSSFLSLPEVNDAALMAMSIHHPPSMWGLAAMTVIGSVVGCTLLYAVGRKGGEALLTKRFAAEKVAKVRTWYARYGMLAVIVPSLMPPPLPFKIFVLSAGAFRISWSRFIIAVAIGRSIRYFAEGMLAVWFGKQAIQMVADNSARVGLLLAGLIVVATLVVVYGRRRRVRSSALLLPLVALFFFSGCVRTITTPENQRLKPSTPFTRVQALDRLRRISQAISSLETPIVLEGSTPEQNDKNKRKSISSLPGTLIVQRPGQINLFAGLVGQGFEIRSNGSQYEVFISLPSKQVHVGTEEGLNGKSSCKLGERATKFVSMKPREILEALVLDFRPLLNSTSIDPVTYILPVVKDQRRYFIVDFVDHSSPAEPRILQKVWFDLSTPEVDIVRREIFDKDGEVERDTTYANPAPLGAAETRYPTRFNIQFVATDTLLTITTDPKTMTLNTTVDPDAFVLGTHNRNAEVCTLEPAAAVAKQ